MLGRGALRRQRGSPAFDDRALGGKILKRLRIGRLGFGQQRLGSALGDEGAAATTTARLDQPSAAQHNKRAAERHRGDPERRGQLHLGGESISGLEQTETDRLAEASDGLGDRTRPADRRKDGPLDEAVDGFPFGLRSDATHASSATSTEASSIISSSS